MAAPDDKSWPRVLFELLKDVAVALGILVALAGGIAAAWAKLEGVRPVVVLALLASGALLFALVQRLRGRARAEGAKEEREAQAKANLNRSTGLYLYAEPYVDLDRGHGVSILRGGHSTESRLSVKIGIRLNNFSDHRIRVREITNVQIDFGGLTVYRDEGMRLVKIGEVSGGARHAHIHEIDVPKLMCLLDSTAAVRVTLHGTLLLDGEWEGREPKAHAFRGDLFVPVEVEYTSAMRDAVDRLRTALAVQGIELLDADLRYDGQWGWDVSVNPRIRTTVPVPAHSPEEARREEALRDVAKRVGEVIRSRFSEELTPQPMRISAVQEIALPDVEAEHAAEDEAIANDRSRRARQ